MAAVHNISGQQFGRSKEEHARDIEFSLEQQRLKQHQASDLSPITGYYAAMDHRNAGGEYYPPDHYDVDYD